MNASHFYELIWKETKRLVWNGGAAWMFLSWRTLPTIQRMSCALSWPIEDLLVWDKEWIGPGGCNGLRPSYELCALFRGDGFSIKDRGIPDIRREKWAGHKPTGHPAEKPEKLCRWLIEISGGDIILFHAITARSP
jgi:DNA modification methylase